MVNYNNAKIYKIYSLVEGADEGDVYYGSTVKPVSARYSNHVTVYRKGVAKCNSRLLFEKYGVENCRAELVQLCPCNTKEELNKFEGGYIRNNKCVNRCIAGRTRQE